MIVRLMGDRQYEIDDSVRERLNEMDGRAMAALEKDDEPELDSCLEEMAELVRKEGKPLPDEDLSPSELIIPPSDLTLEETRQLFSDDGLIPDLPS